MPKSGKKDKKPTYTTTTTKEGEQLKVFEDLETFETFIRNETEDDDFENLHCVCNYYPPFVLHGSHDDPDKIKETENSHNKKFVRHLHQHVEKHLLKDITTLYICQGNTWSSVGPLWIQETPLLLS